MADTISTLSASTVGASSNVPALDRDPTPIQEMSGHPALGTTGTNDSQK